MDRQIAYVGAIPQDIDLLLTNRNVMVAFGLLIPALFGSGTVVDGLACTPTSPAGMTVNVAQGSIYSLQNLESSSYGSLASDTTHQIIKQGIILGTSNFSCPAPSTGGQSVVYLIEAAYQDTDGGSTVLPYYNASNPAVAFNGPGNTGVSQNTVRQGVCKLQVKTGTPAATGTQVTPSPDAGFTGLFAVTVANGQTTITSGNIQQVNTAPFITTKLTGLGPIAPLGIGGGLLANGINLSTANQRPTLNANATYYVATTGSDSNNGLTSGTPFLTIQKAINTLLALDLNGFTGTINVADGTYTGAVSLSQPFIGGTVSLVGNTTTPANCIISTTSTSCISVSNGAQLSVAGFKFQTTTSGNGLAVTGGGSQINVNGNCNFGAMASGGTHVLAQQGGFVSLPSNYTISGGAAYHFNSNAWGEIVVSSATITLSGTPAFASAFAGSAQGLIVVSSANTTFSGSATGTRYSSTANGVINTSGSGATYLPGNAGGTTATGGQYI